MLRIGKGAEPMRHHLTLTRTVVDLLSHDRLNRPEHHVTLQGDTSSGLTLSASVFCGMTAVAGGPQSHLEPFSRLTHANSGELHMRYQLPSRPSFFTILVDH
jgi:hypothetical protein